MTAPPSRSRRPAGRRSSRDHARPAVNRLPVVDRDGHARRHSSRGPTSCARSSHGDAQIAAEIHDVVLLHELWLDPQRVRASRSTGGEVTVTGHALSDDERELLIRRIALVPGVVTVEVRERALV